jgi:hypothetical protein
MELPFFPDVTGAYMKNKFMAFMIFHYFGYFIGFAMTWYIIIFITPAYIDNYNNISFMFTDLLFFKILLGVFILILMVSLDKLLIRTFTHLLKTLSTIYQGNSEFPSIIRNVIQDYFISSPPFFLVPEIDLLNDLIEHGYITDDNEISLRKKAEINKKKLLLIFTFLVPLAVVYIILNIYPKVIIAPCLRVIFSLVMAGVWVFLSRIGYHYNTMINLAKKYNIKDWK